MREKQHRRGSLTRIVSTQRLVRLLREQQHRWAAHVRHPAHVPFILMRSLCVVMSRCMHAAERHPTAGGCSVFAAPGSQAAPFATVHIHILYSATRLESLQFSQQISFEYALL